MSTDGELSATDFLASVGAREGAAYGNVCCILEVTGIEVTFSPGVNRFFQETVIVSALINRGRTMATVESEIPPVYRSRAEAAGWIRAVLAPHFRESELPHWVWD